MYDGFFGKTSILISFEVLLCWPLLCMIMILLYKYDVYNKYDVWYYYDIDLLVLRSIYYIRMSPSFGCFFFQVKLPFQRISVSWWLIILVSLIQIQWCNRIARHMSMNLPLRLQRFYNLSIINNYFGIRENLKYRSASISRGAAWKAIKFNKRSIMCRFCWAYAIHHNRAARWPATRPCRC